MNSNQILSRREEIISELQVLKAELDTLPPGKIICCHQGKSDKWYYRNQGGKNYLSKKEKNFAEKLAWKKYLLLRKEQLQEELKLLNSWMDFLQNGSQKVDKFLYDPSYQKLVKKYFIPQSCELAEWSNEVYEHCENHLENLIHKGISGNVLRSKSEVLIDTMLYQNKIPFRYECKLQLGESLFYPDFTIRHPKSGQVIYWEHFGMMDNPVYVQSYLKKLQVYLKNDIIPTINLICTYETQNAPLTLDIVKNQINQYLL